MLSIEAEIALLAVVMVVAFTALGRLTGRLSGLVASLMLFATALLLWSEYHGAIQAYPYGAATPHQVRAEAVAYILAVSAVGMAVVSGTTGRTTRRLRHPT